MCIFFGTPPEISPLDKYDKIVIMSYFVAMIVGFLAGWITA
jgi:hypothetical protein